ncbi:MAG: 50S ribosomal protein L21e [Candidatus Woesearchaeota archaeon]
MSKRLGGPRRKSRQKFSKAINTKGKISIRKFFQEFKNGDRAALVVDPSYLRGYYHARHHGKSGIIVGMKGSCYKIQINDKNKAKVLVIHPLHLKRLL